MKNLFVIAALLCSTISFAQLDTVDLMLGNWASNDTTCVLSISQTDQGLEFSNWDTLDGTIYNENIINVANNNVSTTLYIPETNWNLNINYYIKNNVLISTCTGSYNGNITYYRILN